MASSQKFIARNRAPRVQIEYDVELYGAEKKVQLPFVMGVMSDLAGKSEVPQPSIEDRKFLEIDVDNFDDRMKAMKPRAAFTVPNTLTGEGNLAVDLTFESMDDFSPAAIARKIEPLRKLLEARTQLSNLMTYMDGKTGAETLIENILQDSALLSALAAGKAETAAQSEVLQGLRAQSADIAAAAANAAAQGEASAQAALDALRSAAPVADQAPDTTAAALDALRAATPIKEDEGELTSAALNALRNAAPEVQEAPDTSAAALEALRASTPLTEAAPDTTTDAALDALRASTPIADEPVNEAAAALDALRAAPIMADDIPDQTASALDALRAAPPVAEEAIDTTADALDALRAATPLIEEEDTTDAALDALRSAVRETSDVVDETGDTLAALRAIAPVEGETSDATEAALDALRAATPDFEPGIDDTASALEALRGAEAPTDETADAVVATLDALRDAAPQIEDTPDTTDAAFEALLSSTPMAEAEPDTTDAALAALLSSTPQVDEKPDTTNAALDALRATPAMAEDAGTDVDATLNELKEVAPIPEAEPDQTDAVLETLHDNAFDTQEEPDPLDGLADLLGEVPEEAAAPPDTDNLLAGLDDLFDEIPVSAEPVDASLSDSDALELSLSDDLSDTVDPLADFAPDPQTSETDMAEDLLAGLDDLLGEDPAAPIADAALEETPADDEAADPPMPDPVDAAADPLADLLADAMPTGSEEDEDPLSGLQDILGESADDADPLADLLADAASTMDALEADVDDLGLSGLLDAGDGDALADLLADTEPDMPLEITEDPFAGLDALLDEADGLTTPEPEEANVADLQEDPLASLDDLLAAPEPEASPLDSLDDLLAVPAEPAPLEEPDTLDDLDALLAEPEAAAPDDSMSLLDDLLGAPEPPAGASLTPFGTLTAPKPNPESLNRPQFRMAIFGDFSGRAARGQIEIGDELATRRAIKFDVDTVEDVIEGFATNLILPIGPDGQGIEVKLGGLDDLHPDELVDNLDLFEALKGLRARLANASTAASAIREMQGWGQTFTSPAAATHSRSSAASIPADKKLSDFQQLIGDTSGRLTQASPIDDMIGQIIGPHVVPGPNAEAAALMENVDAAMSSAMRLVLHHPEFQAVEAQWRSLDLLARRVETDVKLTITLFDVSAEEIAADLAAGDDLAQSGLFRLLNEPLEEEGGIGFSALFGMYTFEETPPHAELLARVAKIAAHIHAPFFTAMAPGFMNTQLKDRHPLTSAAWDKLRKEPAAAYLGLVSPRFLLRRPYGKKTDPIDAFAFEEFTAHEGLKGMLWANPVTLVAVLLAQAWKDGGTRMTLGDVMSMDDLPFHFVTDQYGDQVALPCTERNLTESLTRLVITRGFMPVVSIRGRDVVRLASFQSLAGAEIAGPWSGSPAPRAPAPEPSGLDIEMEIPAAAPPREPAEETPVEASAEAAPETPEPEEDDLDALLASFGDVDTPTDPDAIDADLAALLEGL